MINIKGNISVQIILSVLIMVGCFLLIRLLFVLFPGEKSQPDNTWIKTVGTMTKYAIGRAGKGRILYKIDNVSYEEDNSINSYGMILGEKFNILVNPKNRHQYRMLAWEPVFIEGEATGKCTGTITRVYAFNWGKTDSFNTNHAIEYAYYLNDKKYNRVQFLPPEYTGIHKKLKKNDNFSVTYLLANPQRGVMDILK